MKVTYTTQQIVEATGLPKRTVQFWTAQGVLLPLEKSTGSGVHNRFEWCEIEIAKLLGELSKRRIHSEELSKLSTLFREILKLPEQGFLAENDDLLAFAEKQIDEGGPALTAPRGSGAGMSRESDEARRKRAEWIERTTMAPEQQSKFWCFVAHGLATRKRLPAAWVIWSGLDGHTTIHPRLYFEDWTTAGHIRGNSPNDPHGNWRMVAEGPHDQRGTGIVLDLLLLAG